MNNLSVRKFFILLIVFSLAITVCEAQNFKKTNSRNPERRLFGKSLNKRKVKIKEPRVVIKAKKKQKADEKKLKKEYEKLIRQSKKRALEIQSPEVRARMIQNLKDSNLREKERRKNSRASTKKAARKYRKF
jgi:hypothetical protein